MVIAKEKSIIDIHTEEKKELSHNTKNRHQIIREQEKGEKKTSKQIQND